MNKLIVKGYSKLLNIINLLAFSAVLWLAMLLAIYSVNEMTAASRRFQSVFQKDLDKVSND